MKDLSPSDLKTILHSKRANLYYLEYCRVMQKDGRVLYLTEFDCLRETSAKNGSLPPNADNCLELSFSIRALRLSHTKDVLSFSPVNSTALAINFSSMFTVIRIVKFRLYQEFLQYMTILEGGG